MKCGQEVVRGPYLQPLSEVYDETPAVGRGKVTGERVFFDSEAKSETPDKIFSDEAELLQIELTCLPKFREVCRPLVRALKNVVALVGI